MVIFLTLSLGFCLLAGANFQLAEGNVALAGRVQIVSFLSLLATMVLRPTCLIASNYL